MTTFLIVVIGIGWAFSSIFDNQIILYGAVIFSIVMNIASYWFSDKIVLRMSGAHKATRAQYFDLWNAVENLSITAGLPMPEVYVMDDPSPNAFATGRNEKNSVVAVTTGLLTMLDKSELEGVIAHELAHIKHKDILLQTVVVVLVGFVTLLSDFFLRLSFYGGGNSDRGGQSRIIGLVLGLVLALLAPVIATLLKLAISRKREFMADAGGALITRYPEGLARALKKISSYGGKFKKANHATAHMFIINPFGSGQKARSFMNRLFSTHPPTEERIKALLGTSQN
ncbi:MAG: M48 family metallopeptidase [Candidatus Paceibacterota bacterium]